MTKVQDATPGSNVDKREHTHFITAFSLHSKQTISLASLPRGLDGGQEGRQESTSSRDILPEAERGARRGGPENEDGKRREAANPGNEDEKGERENKRWK